MGKMARIEIGGVDVLVNGVRSQVFDEGAFTLAGIDINAYQIIGVKSSTHFRAGWAPISRAILTADEPGWTSNDLHVFEAMRKKPRSLWPVDTEATYPLELTNGARPKM
jgi:microcystin degradation protein MlrC